MDVNKAKTILIVPLQDDDESYWLAAQALASTLEANEKTVKFFVNTSARKYINAFVSDELSIFDAEGARDVVINITNFKDKANNLSWTQTGNTLEVKIRTENGTLTNPVVEVEQAGISFDIKIFLGMGRSTAEKDKEIRDLKLTSGVVVFLEPKDNFKSPSLLIYEFLENLKFSLNENSASLLLKSIYSYTQNFSKNTDSSTFELAAKLAKVGDSIEKMPISSPKPQIVKEPQIEKLIPLDQVIKEIESKPEENPNVETTSLDKETESEETSKENPTVVTPEELPADFDPLAPAKTLPEPIRSQGAPRGIQPTGPLPSAQ